MIHKIEIFPHYTYPSIPNIVEISGGNNEQAVGNDISTVFQGEDEITGQKLLPPYRTVSHYGFNYPSTYMPNISLHPAYSVTPVNLQRQKVIAFIKRLNFEVNDNQKIRCSKAESLKGKNDLKTGKEENIYENCLTHLEIKLNAAKHKIKSHLRSSQHQQRSHPSLQKQIHQSNQIDLQSNQFSSLLSISGTYPAAFHSQIEDAENDHFTTDSGENFSNFELQPSRKSNNENLYRSYFQRNYIPEAIGSHHSIIDFRERDDEPDPHKPESEQQSQNNIKHSPKFMRNHESKHITLTLNSLKRRASSICDNREKTKNHHKSLSTPASSKTQCSDTNSSCDSSTTSTTAIEIHININIRNSDCAKNLQNHEQEFKTKLEKVIDDEINLITQELALSPQCERQAKNTTSFQLTPSHRSLSAPESISFYGRDPSCAEADRNSLFNFNETAHSAPMDQTLPMSSNLQAMKYRQTLTMIEQELEILLNSIIQNMCDCKTKITQMSEGIRTATLHVGSLKPMPFKKRSE